MTGKTLTETAEDLLTPGPPPSRAEQAKAIRGAKVWTWIARGVGISIVLAVLALGAYLAVANAGARAERFELLEQIDAERQLVDAERAKVDALYEQLQDLGEDPIVTPSDPSPAPTGPSGPTGPQGIAGRTPSMGDVLDAVDAYCVSIGGCVGADGEDGASGTNGGDGAPGAPGESITGPAGPQGPAGTNGTDGAPGVSVTGVSCVLLDDLSTAFRFTFSDATAVDVPGACFP